MSDEALAAVVDQVARTLSRPVVEALASALARTPHPDADARRAVLAVMPVGVFTVEATRLLDAWGEHAANHTGRRSRWRCEAPPAQSSPVAASRPSTSSGPVRPRGPCPCG